MLLQALQAIERALMQNPGNAEIVKKRHQLKKLVREPEAHLNRDKENHASNKPVSTSRKDAGQATEVKMA